MQEKMLERPAIPHGVKILSLALVAALAAVILASRRGVPVESTVYKAKNWVKCGQFTTDGKGIRLRLVGYHPLLTISGAGRRAGRPRSG